MITRLSHMNVFVIDQQRALDFYVNKLGFKLVEDAPMGPELRWLTVSPPDQPDLEIILFPIKGSKAFPPEARDLMIGLIEKGSFGCGVLTCVDIYATYEELKSKGVEFMKAPKKEFYGIEALFKDDSGNYFSLKQQTSAG